MQIVPPNPAAQGLLAANARGKSKRFTSYVRRHLRRALTFGFLLWLGLCGGLRSRLLFRPARFPAGLVHLPAAPERKRPRRHVLGDDRSGTHIGAGAYLHGCDQRRVRSDERTLADIGAVLCLAVVIAEDRPRPDIGAVANIAVADIGEMVGLSALPDLGLLHLDEIADARFRPKLRARPQPRKWADRSEERR